MCYKLTKTKKTKKKEMLVDVDQELHEWHWAALSHIITPTFLKTLLIKASQDSLFDFNRVASSVFWNMFQTLRSKLDHLDRHSTRVFFETYLMDEGFIPKQALNQISNDVFGFVNSRGIWVEWNISAVEVIRMYWDQMLRKVTTKHKKDISHTCQRLIALLPGRKVVCGTCTWSLPESAMYSDALCNYCRGKNRAILKTFHNTPYLYYAH